MFGLSVWEILVVMLVALVIFGPKRLPELGKALGRGLAEFRKASNDLRTAIESEQPDSPPDQPATRQLPNDAQPSVDIIDVEPEKVPEDHHDPDQDWRG